MREMYQTVNARFLLNTHFQIGRIIYEHLLLIKPRNECRLKKTNKRNKI